MTGLRLDVVDAARQLRRAPGFTVLAAAVLALGRAAASLREPFVAAHALGALNYNL